jgi:hypothetical protein
LKQRNIEEQTMRRAILTLSAMAVTAGVAAAQPQYPTQPFPGYQYGQPNYGPTVNPNNFMPNIYNPQSQPLSPYLNLLRGSNPATNYYYNVRPGTVGMGGHGYSGAPFMAFGGNRMQFFPQLASAPDPLNTELSGAGDVLPPAGHTIVFNNTNGFFPSSGGQAGGARPGLAGVGATRAPVKK